MTLILDLFINKTLIIIFTAEGKVPLLYAKE